MLRCTITQNGCKKLKMQKKKKKENGKIEDRFSVKRRTKKRRR